MNLEIDCSVIFLIIVLDGQQRQLRIPFLPLTQILQYLLYSAHQDYHTLPV